MSRVRQTNIVFFFLFCFLFCFVLFLFCFVLFCTFVFQRPKIFFPWVLIFMNPEHLVSLIVKSADEMPYKIKGNGLGMK